MVRSLPDMSDGVVFVEIPAGSRNKYEWDDELGGIALDRRLFTSMTYPADYGYLEGTLAEDGDPLDALVLVAEPTFPGCRIRVRPIGVFHMSDEKGPDEKLLCVPLADPSFERVRDIHDVRHLLLSHIHLDHAGAAGALVREHPALQVHVSEIGAPHLVDPAKLERSAPRLYEDSFDRLWGELAPVP